MNDTEISDLLKNATAKKSSGDIDGAIVSLKKAYDGIKDTDICYPVETFLRLPLYLQAAKRNDEAWREFNNLIAFGFPNQMNDPEIKPFEESTIYDKMRLFLQREGKNELAILFGIYSYLKAAIALHRQKRNSELANHKEEVEENLKTLLKKAKREHLIKQYSDIVKKELKQIDQIDLTIVRDKLTSLDSQTVK
jgi:hypothetical protein